MKIDMEAQLRGYTGYVGAQSLPVEVEDILAGRTRLEPAQPSRPKRRFIAALAFASGLVVVLVAFGGAILLNRSGDVPPVVEPTTPVVTTLTVPATTEPATATTEPDTVVVPFEPGGSSATVEWSRVSDPNAVLDGGDGYRFLEAVTVGGPGLVAVGGVCEIGDCDISLDGVGWSAAVWVSADGLVWEQVPHDAQVFGGAGDHVMLDVTVGGPGLVAVGVIDPSGFGAGRWQGLVGVGPLEELDGAIWVSSDGLSWERVTDPAGAFTGEGDQIITAVISGGPGLIAVGASNDDAVVWVSEDGFTWRMVPQDEEVFGGRSNEWIFDVTLGGPGVVAVGVDWDCPPCGGVPRSVVWVSANGLDWSRVPYDDAIFRDDELMWAVTSTSDGLVASGWTYEFGEDVLWRSPDGINWQPGADGSELAAGTKHGPVRDLVVLEGEAIGVGWDSESVTTGNIPRQYFPNFTFDYFYPRNSMNGAVVFEGRIVAVGYYGADAVVWLGDLVK